MTVISFQDAKDNRAPTATAHNTNIINTNRAGNVTRTTMDLVLKQLHANGIDPRIDENLDLLCVVEKMIGAIVRRNYGLVDEYQEAMLYACELDKLAQDGL